MTANITEANNSIEFFHVHKAADYGDGGVVFSCAMIKLMAIVFLISFLFTTCCIVYLCYHKYDKRRRKRKKRKKDEENDDY